MDEMRNRLIAALKTAKDEIIDLDLNGLADKLIAEGVILPKFKLGQEVWINAACTRKPEKIRVCDFKIRNRHKHTLVFYDCGWGTYHESMVHATESEARAALEGKE